MSIKKITNNLRKCMSSSFCIIKKFALKCISFATGTRSDDHDETGLKLHDSHAEVLAKRSCQKYILSMRMNLPESDFISWLERKKFHFFCSHLPCGDAVIRPKYTSTDAAKRPKITDIYRTGAKVLKTSPIQDKFLPGENYHETEDELSWLIT